MGQQKPAHKTGLVGELSELVATSSIERYYDTEFPLLHALSLRCFPNHEDTRAGRYGALRDALTAAFAHIDDEGFADAAQALLGYPDRWRSVRSRSTDAGRAFEPNVSYDTFRRADGRNYRHNTLLLIADGLAKLDEVNKNVAAETVRPDPALTIETPPPSNEIFGRTHDLLQLADALAESRLVTMIGPAGVGKTTLATEVLRTSTKAFDEVYFVELAAVVDPTRVPAAVAEAVLGVEPVTRAGNAIDRLATAIAPRSLIVLDNCEHVTAAAREFADRFLAMNRDVTLLATSREALGVDAERVMPIATLAVDGPPKDAPAVQLFVTRANTAAQGLAPLDLELVADLCERLDGHPLAIELTSARLNVLSLQDLSDRLLEAARAPMRRGRRTERHATLDIAIGWSHSLLDPNEQTVLALVSVFPGSFDIDAAHAVCGDDFSFVETLDVLDSLNARSFIEILRDGPKPRFRLLTVIREFARDHLNAADTNGAKDRHQDHFIQRTAALANALDRRPDDLDVRDLELENESFLDAIALTDSPQRKTSARKLAVNLRAYWEETGRFNEGFECIRSLLGPQDQGARLWRSILGLAVSYGAVTGRLNELANEEAELANELPPEPHVAYIDAYIALGFAALGRAEMEDAAHWFETGAHVIASMAPPIQRRTLVIAGACAAYDEDTGRALELLSQAKNVDHAGGAFDTYVDVFWQAVSLQAAPTDQPEERLESLRAGLTELIDEELSAHTAVAVQQAALGFDRAQAFADFDHWVPVGLEAARACGHRWSASVAIELLAWSATRRGDDTFAATCWGVADAALESSGFNLPRAHRATSTRYRSEVQKRMTADAYDAAHRQGAATELAVFVGQL